MTWTVSMRACAFLVATTFVGCGSSTDVKLADVPPVTQEPPKQTKAFPKKATHSPAVLPGSEGK